jgi:O-antigen/teichoic acid export membrane protein
MNLLLPYRFNLKSVFLKYLSSTVSGSVVGIFSGFFTYRYIEPDKLGIWSLFVVIEVYATFTRLGVINGLGRELPYLLGVQKNDLAKDYASTALLYSLVSNLLLLLIIPFLFLTDVLSIDNRFYFFSFIVILFRLLFTSYSSYLSVTFRTSKNFNDLSNIQFILIIVKISSLALVVFYGFWGLLIREFLLSLFEVVLLHRKRPIEVAPRFNKHHFISLIKVGFPLFLVSYIAGFVDTFPRLFLIRYGTIEQLGLFSPVLVMLGTALLLPNAIGSYMYPKMSYEYGLNNKKSNLWKTVKLTSLISFVSGLLIFLLVFFLADYIKFIFPKYVETIPYIKMGSFALLFIGYRAAGLSFSVLKSWNVMIFNMLSHLLISVLSLFILYFYIQDSLMIAVISMVITYSFMFFLSLFLSYKVTHQP